jgi:hypothetical protein
VRPEETAQTYRYTKMSVLIKWKCSWYDNISGSHSTCNGIKFIDNDNMTDY